MSTAAKSRNGILVATVTRIAQDVAAAHADEVDREARFPREAVEAFREEGVLAAFVPAEMGGLGASVGDLAEACFELGRCCAASAMVFAMHQMQVACLVRLAPPRGAAETFLRQLAEEQWLIASVTSEVGTGGDLGRSVAAVERPTPGRVRFEKHAPTVSYGEYADAYMTTLRRDPGAPQGDQVLVLTRREDTVLEPLGEWDTMGMRGTCSPPFRVRADAPDGGVLDAPFATVLAESMQPLSYVLWAHAWLGVATDAADRVRRFARESARRAPQSPGLSTLRVAELMARLQPLSADVRASVTDFEAMDATPDRAALHMMPAALRFNALKIAASEGAVDVCRLALGAVGLAGYRNDNPFSVARHLRDALSAPLMVANDRVLATNGDMLRIVKEL